TNLFIILDERSSSISLINHHRQHHYSMIIVNINDERSSSISLFNDHC
ncbi:unnamed protein product, partial [Rotaria magnacalcarata]